LIHVACLGQRGRGLDATPGNISDAVIVHPDPRSPGLPDKVLVKPTQNWSLNKTEQKRKLRCVVLSPVFACSASTETPIKRNLPCVFNGDASKRSWESQFLLPVYPECNYRRPRLHTYQPCQDLSRSYYTILFLFLLPRPFSSYDNQIARAYHKLSYHHHKLLAEHDEAMRCHATTLRPPGYCNLEGGGQLLLYRALVRKVIDVMSPSELSKLPRGMWC